MNIVQLEIIPLEEVFVFLVLLDLSPLELAQLNVNLVHVDILLLRTEQHVILARQVNTLLQLEEIVLSVQSEQSVIQLLNVSVLNVELELKPMQH